MMPGKIGNIGEYVDSTAKGVKAPMQIREPIIMPIYGSIIASRVSIDLIKSFAFKSVKIGTFEVNF